MADREQKRAIFFSFDGGTGVGHLRRLARIAKRLQGRFACLLVTDRSAAGLLVPEECEYVHLPSWDSLLDAKARYWNRPPFMSLTTDEGVRFRKRIIEGIIEAFDPDVIFVDHLPLGAYEELTDVIRNARGIKYLVTRGVQNETEDLQRLVLGGLARELISTYYHRVLVAMDPQVFDLAKNYNISSDISGKAVHTGYVIDSVSDDSIKATRERHGLQDDDIWVVASAGGGQLGEQLIQGCLELTNTHKNIVFDIVHGPRSSLPLGHGPAAHDGDNVRVHKENGEMPYLHASADLVISSGGYNSLLEALQGNAKILCFPLRKDHRDEQYRHATSLQRFVDIEVSTDLTELPEIFGRAIQRHESRDRRTELAFNGAARIEQIVVEDLLLTQKENR
jgi:predicted glycosyltransferase